MMRSCCGFLAFGLLFLAAPSPAQAGIDWSINIDLPVTRPRMALVQPDIRVIEDVNEEVFFTEGRYWVLRNGYWYSARSHRGNFRRSPRIRTPWRLSRLQPGSYRNYRRNDPRNSSRGNSAWGHGQSRRDDRIDARMERKDDRRERKEDRKERKEDRKDHRRH